MTDGNPPAPDGPARIRSIAVHRDDVATALEATLRSDREVVLRVTPPFSGRMRARLHSLGAETTGEADAGEGKSSDDGSAPAPIHVDPRDLVSDVPPYPEVDETMADHPEVDETMADHPDADVETRRQRHTEAVESWREAVRESVVDGVELDVGGGDGGGDRDGETIAVDVAALG